MAILRIINLGVLVLIGCLAGAVKLAPGSADLFLQQAGLGVSAIKLMGVVQIASGILLIPAVTRPWAAAALAITLLVSSVSIFMAGRTDLGWYSLVIVAMVAFVIYEHPPKIGRPAKQD